MLLIELMVYETPVRARKIVWEWVTGCGLAFFGWAFLLVTQGLVLKRASA